MVNIAEVKNVMDECSMPFQMPLVDFVSRALEINEDVFGALLHKRTKKDILTYLKSSSVTFEDLRFLLVRIVASLNKYCGIINIIKRIISYRIRQYKNIINEHSRVITKRLINFLFFMI